MSKNRWLVAGKLMLGMLGMLALCVQGTALAQNSVYVEELTTQEVSAALKAGKTTVLIPIGGTEQIGPHMAIGKHNVRAKALAGNPLVTHDNLAGFAALSHKGVGRSPRELLVVVRWSDRVTACLVTCEPLG